MSLTLRALALRVCHFLGYYEERIKKLEEEIAVLKKQNDLLGSTTCLYVQTCNVLNCKNWWIDGDDVDLVYGNNDWFSCECGEMICKEHGIQNIWDLSGEYGPLCEKCKIK